LRQNRSVIECHLKPLLGHLAVNKLTTATSTTSTDTCCAPAGRTVAR
jgi:hypothetical protein